MREGREEKKKKKIIIIIIIGPVPITRCHLALHQLGDLLRGAWRRRWIALGGRLDTPPPPGGRRRLLSVRAVGKSPPFPAPPSHGRWQQAPAHGDGNCPPCSMAPQIPHSGEGSLTARSSFLPGFGTNVTRFRCYGKKEAGTGEHLKILINK